MDVKDSASHSNSPGPSYSVGIGASAGELNALEQKVEERTLALKQEIQERQRTEGLLVEARDHYLNILAEAPALSWRARTTSCSRLLPGSRSFPACFPSA